MSAFGMLSTLVISQLHMLERGLGSASVKIVRTAIDEAFKLGKREGQAERDALALQVKQLQEQLAQQKLVHIGFTNGSQVRYVTERKQEGGFYPDNGYDSNIAVYMLATDAHHVGLQSEVYKGLC